MAITRLWFFTRKPTTTPNSYASFLALWTDVLELCATYSPSPGPSSSQTHLAMLSRPCPQRPHHFLFQTTTNSHSQDGDKEKKTEEKEEEPLYVLISSYPSLALCKQADVAYTSRYRTRVLEYVEHRALRQMDLEDAELVPALLSSSSSSPSSLASSKAEKSKDESDQQNYNNQQQKETPTVLVTISNRDPLELEVARSLSSPRGTGGKRLSAVPPPEEEISGRDTYEIPPLPPPIAVPAPALVKVDGQGGEVDGKEKKDFFALQRGEGTKWIRISRRLDVGADIAGVGGEDVDVEVFRLHEVLAR